MQRNHKETLLSAPRAALAAVLCALLMFAAGCGFTIDAAPTPFLADPTPTPSRRHRSPTEASTSAATAPTATAAGSAPAASAAETTDVQSIYMRGVWVASIVNIDFPTSLDDVDAQKEEYSRILDNARSWGLDTVFVQVRPMGDALYRSELNPWSSFLTGTQGKDPGWDPLEYMIEETHSRGMTFHAWLNPYRVLHPGSKLTVADLAEGNIAKEHPEWLITHESYLYLDPARDEVKQHIADTVKEIVDNYDVDGIHFDDYFYPADYPLPDGAERDGYIDMERRTHVNDMLRRVKNICLEADHPVMFGVSPFGVWKNSSSDPEGSDTSANESYYSMSADSVRWIKEGLIDYIAPQLYWPIGHDKAEYRTLADWWAEQTAGTGVSLIIGQGLHDEAVSTEISEELAVNASVPQITGSIFFSYSDLADNEDAADAVKRFWEEHPSYGAAPALAESSAPLTGKSDVSDTAGSADESAEAGSQSATD